MRTLKSLFVLKIRIEYDTQITIDMSKGGPIAPIPNPK